MIAMTGASGWMRHVPWKAALFLAAIAACLAGLSWLKREQVRAESTAPPRRVVDPYRLDVKLTTDPDAATIDRTPVDTTLARLVNSPQSQSKGREEPLERRVWRVHGTIKNIAAGEDGDMVVTIESQGTKTTAEAPVPALCAGSPFQHEIATVRQTLQAKKGKLVGAEVTVCGIGFRGLRGPAVGTAVKLYPLLEITTGSAR
jgi:hypothetical protein